MIKTITLVLGVMALQTLAHADPGDIKLLTITAQAYPGQTDFCGIDVDSNNNVTQLYFTGGDGTRTVYTLEQLNAGVTLIQSNGDNVINLQVNYDTSNKSAVLNLSYLTSGITNDYSSDQLTLNYNSSTKQFELRDSNSDLVNTAYVESNTFLGQVIGVSQIDFSDTHASSREMLASLE